MPQRKVPTSCSGGRTAKRSIQSAVNASDRNDDVVVCPGIYSGKVLIKGSSRNGMRLRAAALGTVTLRASSSLKEGSLVTVQEVSNVLVRGLRLSFFSSGCVIRSDVVTGFWVTDANGTDLVSNTIRATCSATQGRCGYNDGIRVRYSTGVVIDANTVRDLKRGSSFERGSHGRVEDNKVQFYHTKSTSNDDGKPRHPCRQRLTGGGCPHQVRSLSPSGDPKLNLGISIPDAAGGSNVDDNIVRFTKTGIGIKRSESRVALNDVPGAGLLLGIHVLGVGTVVDGNLVRGHDTGIRVDTDGGLSPTTTLQAT